MSNNKRKVGSNTLFNYFTPNKKPKVASEASTSERNDETLLSVSATSFVESDDESPVVKNNKSRKRIRPVVSDSSDEENKADNIMEECKEEVSSVGKRLQDSFKYDPNQSPKVNSKEKQPLRMSKASSVEEERPVAVAPVEQGEWLHYKLDWLKPEKIKDANLRRPDDPDYDATTLHVPTSFLTKQTPAHRQWWEMKSKHYDCMLFFKVGKFYELYHMDAVIAVNELGIIYMKGEFAHSGFPEMAYHRMASALVAKGYKVARVEQTETPKMMQDRLIATRKGKKDDKVVRREICQVTVRGTHVCGLLDAGPAEPNANYMMAIAEEDSMEGDYFGVCFLDASLGKFHLGQFKDDKHKSRLLTTLAHYPPVLVVYDRHGTSSETSQMLNTYCHSARRERLTMWPPEKVLQTLAEKYYKTNENGDWPPGLKPFLHEGDTLGLTPASGAHLAIKALGGCVAYLTQCLLDIQILTMSSFTTYNPPDAQPTSPDENNDAEFRWKGGNTMVLDAISLRNLRVVQEDGCLYQKLNFCVTPMGKRLLYQWVCAPSCNLTDIKERQGAVQVLLENQELAQDARNVLGKLPDLERLLVKVHTLGSAVMKDHPDSRAIMYENDKYTKRKIEDFLAVINGFTEAMQLVQIFADVEADLLKRVTQYEPHGKYPNYENTLKHFKEGFDQELAKKLGKISPEAGVDEEFDAAVAEIEAVEAGLAQYLAQEEAKLRCRLSYYVPKNKKNYALEVPESAAAKAGPEYYLDGSRKGFKRFTTDALKVLEERMASAQEAKAHAELDVTRRVLERFSSHRRQWEAALRSVATLDVLLSLAEFARQLTGNVCRPTLTFSPHTKPFIDIKEGRHPCLCTVEEFIPNDTSIGGDEASLMLLTGPNMGGKSTLMRQLALITLLAHIGSYVPALECRMSVVDRIFTRLGASDDILSGQSTFLVEMNETAAIVKHATVHSLVLLDELGRGTSTYDGTAIAMGVCVALEGRGCRTVFSTHYHNLVTHLANSPAIKLAHMACLVETDESSLDNDDEVPDETITFLYKVTAGACPKSHGFNAAKLAGISSNILRRARHISKQLEIETGTLRAFKDLMAADKVQVIKAILKDLRL